MQELLTTLDRVPTPAWIGLRVLVVLLLAWLMLRLYRRLIHRLNEKGALSGRGEIIMSGIGRTLIIVFALLIVLEQAGISTGTVWAGVSAVAVMVAVGFVAVWSVLSNALCGALLLIYAPFRIGDDIELVDLGSLNALRGRVTNMNLMFVQIREAAPAGDDNGTGFITQVPNNHFFQRGIRRKQRTGARATQPLADSFTMGRNEQPTVSVAEDARVEAVAAPGSTTD